MTVEEMNAKYGKPPVSVNAPTGPSDLESAWGISEASKPSIMDTIKSRTSAMVEDPGEALKGVVKGAVGGTAGLTKLVDMGITGAGAAMSGDESYKPGDTMLDYAPIEELTSPSNEAQAGGSNLEAIGELALGGKGLLKPAKAAFTAGKEYIEKRGVEKASNFIKDLITPELTQTKGINAIKTGKVTEGGLLKDRDITGAVPFFEDTAKAVSKVPGVSKGKTLLENNNAIHDHIGTIADDLVSQLKISGKEMKISDIEQVPAKFNEYMKGVKTTLKENPTLVGDAEKTATKILDKFDSLVKEEGSTPDAILSARKKLDAWMSAQKGDNVFDPKTEGAVSVALRAVRQGGNDFLSKLSKDVKVKEMLAEQTSLYNAIDNISPKAFKEGASGFKRWVKAHPKIVGATKILGGAAVGGGTAGALLNQ